MKLGVLKIQHPKESVRHITTGDDLVRKLRCLRGYYINPEVKPVAQALRRPAFSLMEQIEKKLGELQQEDII